MTYETKKVAFLGLGAMGSRMALRLVQAGFSVTVYNRSPKAAKPLVEAGAKLAKTPREAATEADFVFSMVTDNEASREVWTASETGALLGLKSGAIAIEVSTLTPSWVQELSTLVEASKGRFLEAPVAGSRPQADAGKLVFFVGGDSASLDEARDPILRMGEVIHHMGDIGAGATTKLVVNGVFGAQVAVLGELLGLATRSGMQREGLLDVLNTLPITSPALQGIGKLVSSSVYAPMFPVGLVAKDFRYIENAAASADATTPAISSVRADFEEAEMRGFGAENIHAVVKIFE